MDSNTKLCFVHALQAAEGKKVSRAESWRYEASIYVSPGRQKPSGMHVWDINKHGKEQEREEILIKTP